MMIYSRYVQSLTQVMSMTGGLMIVALTVARFLIRPVQELFFLASIMQRIFYVKKEEEEITDKPSIPGFEKGS